MFLSTVSPGFSLELDPKGRMGGLGRKVGVVVRNLRTMKVVYWVNVSESSGASSHRLSRIKGH